MISLKSNIKQFLLKIKKGNYLKKEVQCKHVWYGNNYGGFYVNPELISNNSIVYSFGIGEDISFDKAVIKNNNCQVFGFDPTPKSINWIDKQNLSENFHFYKYGISNKNGFVDFFTPKNPNHVSGSITAHENVDVTNKVSVEMKTLESIMQNLGHDHIDVLKMDIEGSEYDVIENILDSNLTITQILIEFHDRFFENGEQKTKQAVNKLRENGYKIFAISKSFEEISFVNEKLL